MKINSFSYEDKSRGWKLETTFFDRLTLLVGASGVGKTQILRAINQLTKIVQGSSINGVSWHVELSTLHGEVYTWEGEFELQDVYPFLDDEYEQEAKNKPGIIFERIYRNEQLLASREYEKIFFQGKETVKLAKEKSLVHLLAEEDSIRALYKEVRKIRMNDHSDALKEPFRIHLFDYSNIVRKFDTLQKIQEADLDVGTKLFLTFKNDKKTFNKIKARFTDIFPQVEDVKLAPLEAKYESAPPFFKDHPFIQIKEKGVDKWVEQGRISSGMFRSLFHISELYLSPEGTVFLIDEFENSLGINYIDELTGDILNSRRAMQFIITSHHPYIINNINFKNWKLVTRNAGVVKTHSASEYNLGKSKHDAFMQLLQLEAYQTGSEVI